MGKERRKAHWSSRTTRLIVEAGEKLGCDAHDLMRMCSQQAACPSQQPSHASSAKLALVSQCSLRGRNPPPRPPLPPALSLPPLSPCLPPPLPFRPERTGEPKHIPSIRCRWESMVMASWNRLHLMCVARAGKKITCVVLNHLQHVFRVTLEAMQSQNGLVS